MKVALTDIPSSASVGGMLHSELKPRRFSYLGIFLALFGVAGCAARGSCWMDSELLGRVSAARNLPFTRTVPCEVESTSELRKYLNESVAKRTSRERLFWEGRMLKIFGLLPEEFAYPEGVYDFYAQELLALYDPEGKKVLVSKRERSVRDRSLLAHELTHALQDQHFNVEQIMDYGLTNDEINSRSALLEGDAIWVSAAPNSNARCTDLDDESILSGLELTRAASSRFPKAIRTMMEFPYLYGQRLVCELHNKGGSELLDLAFRNLPQSSSEVMRPERYIKRLKDRVMESPRVFVSTSRCPSPFTYEDRLGEFLVATALAEFLPLKESFERASNYRDDRVYYYRSPAETSGDGGKNYTEELCWAVAFGDLKSATDFRVALKAGSGIRRLDARFDLDEATSSIVTVKLTAPKR